MLLEASQTIVHGVDAAGVVPCHPPQLQEVVGCALDHPDSARQLLLDHQVLPTTPTNVEEAAQQALHAEAVSNQGVVEEPPAHQTPATLDIGSTTIGGDREKALQTCLHSVTLPVQQVQA